MRIFLIIFFLVLFIMPLSIKKSFETDFEFNYFLEGFGWSMGISNDSNKIYVADGTKNEILVFNKIDGVFLDRILLNVEKCIGHTHGMEIKLEKIFVVKENYDCIAIFDLDGNFLQEFESNFKIPHQLIIIDNILYVLDTYNYKVKIFSLIDYDEFQNNDNTSILLAGILLTITIIIVFIFLRKKLVDN